MAPRPWAGLHGEHDEPGGREREPGEPRGLHRPRAVGRPALEGDDREHDREPREDGGPGEAREPCPRAARAEQDGEQRTHGERVHPAGHEDVGGERAHVDHLEQRQAHHRHAEDDGAAEPGERLPGQRRDEEGPHQVELLFDRERPEVIQVHPVHVEDPAPAHGDEDVGEVAPEPELLAPELRELRGPPRDEARGDEEDDQQERVVEGEDAQHAPHVEVLVVAGAPPRAEEDPGDQEAGEDEEQVDPRPPHPGHRQQGLAGEGLRRMTEREVVEHHRQDGDAADAVEGAEVRCSGRLRPSIRRACRHEGGRYMQPMRCVLTAMSSYQTFIAG